MNRNQLVVLQNREQRTVETHGRASLQSGIIHFLLSQFCHTVRSILPRNQVQNQTHSREEQNAQDLETTFT